MKAKVIKLGKKKPMLEQVDKSSEGKVYEDLCNKALFISEFELRISL